MDKFAALLSFLLSLFGFDGGGSTLVHRASADGVDTLHSRTHVQSGVTRFECVRSASGYCHYTVLPRACAADGRAADCASRPVERFALADGDSRQVTGLQAFRLCVSADAGAPGTGCAGVADGTGKHADRATAPKPRAYSSRSRSHSSSRIARLALAAPYGAWSVSSGSYPRAAD